MAALVFPTNPTNNQEFTASNGILYVYKTDKWVSLGAIVDYVPDPTLFAAVVSPNAPSAPQIGNLWFNTVSGITYVWYQDEDQSGVEGQWIDVRPPTTTV